MNSTLNGFMFDGARLHDLGSLGGGATMPFGINNRDQIVGRSALADAVGGVGVHAFLVIV